MPKSNRKSHPSIPSAGRPRGRWQLQDAKARFSELVRESRKEPQIITYRGEEVAVLQSIESYRKKNAKREGDDNLFAALLACPPGPELVIHRDPDDTVSKLPPIFGSDD